MRKKLGFILLFAITLITNQALASDWYVRPAGGNYGTENGASYSNAWDGFINVVWGAGGVQAGDTLWACGLHLRTFAEYPSFLNIPLTSGTNADSRVIIRGDYPEDQGIIWGAGIIAHDNWNHVGDNTYGITMITSQYPDWFFEDITTDSWNVLYKADSLSECRSTPGSFYAAGFSNGDILYVHCSDNGNPTNRISANRLGYQFSMNNSQYITFLNLKAYSVYNMFLNGLNGDAAQHIRFEGCTIWYNERAVLHLRRNMSYIDFYNCDIAWAKNGLDFSEQAAVDGTLAPHHCTISGCTFHDIGVREGDIDAHCVSWQGGHDNLIEKNEMYNCGTGITFYMALNQSMTDCIVRWNYVHDTHTNGGANGRGIEFNGNGENSRPKSGNTCYGNIVANVNDVGYRDMWSGSDSEVTFFNNIAYNCRISFYFVNKYGAFIVLRNNVSMNPIDEHIHYGCTQASTGNYKLDSDNNCFYPTSGQQLYFYASGSGGFRTFVQWQTMSRPGCNFDLNSTNLNPEFTNSSGTYSYDIDFRLQSQSPLIDAGADVNLDHDYEGTPIPQGYAPDIGAFECIKPIYSKIIASPSFGGVPLTVNFRGDVIGDNPPFFFEWNFGDGQSSNEQNPNYTYSEAGNYTATFFATDNINSTETDDIIINVYPPTHQLSIHTVLIFLY